MTSHELARKLLEMEDLEVEIPNALHHGDMGAEIQAIRYYVSRDGSKSIQIDSDRYEHEMPLI